MYQINPDIEKLRAEKAAKEKQIEQLKHQQQRLRNQIQYIHKGERSKRTHRLVTKGAAIESIAPNSKDIGAADFYKLMSTVLTNPRISGQIDKLADKAGNE